jgi:hypothetical protein
MYFLANIVAIIGWVWIVVNAFRNDGVGWGIGCLICGPIFLFYGIKNFGDNKIPLLMAIVGIAVAAATMPAEMVTGMQAQ